MKYFLKISFNCNFGSRVHLFRAARVAVGGALLATLPAFAQFGLGVPNVGDDPEFLSKLNQRDFSTLEQTAEGKAQAYVVGVMAALCLSAAGVQHPLMIQIRSEQVLSWAGNQHGQEDVGLAAARGLNLLVMGAATPPGLKYMPYFGQEGACKNESKRNIARNLLDYLTESSFGTPSRESTLSGSATAGLVASGLVEPSYNASGRMYAIRSVGARDNIWNQMKTLSSAGQKMLRCMYGPYATTLGSPQTLYFWHGKVPRSRKFFTDTDVNNPLGQAGNLALAECPPTASAARQFQARAWGAAFDEPAGAVSRWTCRPFEDQGFAPHYSVLAQHGVAPGATVTFKFDVDVKTVSGVSEGKAFEIQGWERVEESETGLMFLTHRPATYENKRLRIRHTLTTFNSFVTEEVVLLSPTYISEKQARLSWRRMLCKQP